MDEPYTDIRESLFFQPVEGEEIDTVRTYHKVKAKKRKNPCPNCQKGELRRKFITDEIIENTVRGHQETWCNTCDYRAKEA